MFDLFMRDVGKHTHTCKFYYSVDKNYYAKNIQHFQHAFSINI